VKWLAANGAEGDVHRTSEIGVTPLGKASRRGHLEVVKWLILQGATEGVEGVVDVSSSFMHVVYACVCVCLSVTLITVVPRRLSVSARLTLACVRSFSAGAGPSFTGATCSWAPCLPVRYASLE
jgi:hypothetical protein